MKNKNLFTAAVLGSVLLFSCSKENINPESNTPSSTPTASYLSGTPSVQAIMNNYRAMSLSRTDEDYFAKIEQANAWLNSPNLNQTNPEIIIEEIFSVYEGMLNYNFSELNTHIEEHQYLEFEASMPYHISGSGEYSVQVIDVNNFYYDLQNTIESEVLSESTSAISAIDLNLLDINPANGSIKIKVYIAHGTKPFQQGLSVTPPFAVWASENLGTCSNPGAYFFDATYYLKAHLNSTAPHNTYTCNSPLSKHFEIMTMWDNAGAAYGGLFFPTIADYANSQLWARTWKNDANECLGNNSSEWNSLYSDIEYIRDWGFNAMVNQFGSNPMEEFIMTDYHSHYYSPSGPIWAPDGTNRQYHAGMFFWGKVRCQ